MRTAPTTSRTIPTVVRMLMPVSHPISTRTRPKINTYVSRGRGPTGLRTDTQPARRRNLRRRADGPGRPAEAFEEHPGSPHPLGQAIGTHSHRDGRDRGRGLPNP